MEDSFYGCANLTIETDAGQPDLSKCDQSMAKATFQWRRPHSTSRLAAGMLAASPICQTDVLVAQPCSTSRLAATSHLAAGMSAMLIKMGDMFRDATEFDQDLGAWDVGKVAEYGGHVQRRHTVNRQL